MAASRGLRALDPGDPRHRDPRSARRRAGRPAACPSFFPGTPDRARRRIFRRPEGRPRALRFRRPGACGAGARPAGASTGSEGRRSVSGPLWRGRREPAGRFRFPHRFRFPIPVQVPEAARRTPLRSGTGRAGNEDAALPQSRGRAHRPRRADRVRVRRPAVLRVSGGHPRLGPARPRGAPLRPQLQVPPSARGHGGRGGGAERARHRGGGRARGAQPAGHRGGDRARDGRPQPEPVAVPRLRPRGGGRPRLRPAAGRVSTTRRSCGPPPAGSSTNASSGAPPGSDAP